MSEKPVGVLKIDEKQKITYCVPLWLRDEQIKVNCATVKGRIGENYPLREDPIAIVNFGPSLNETWEQVREFKYVMSCSGSHKFLVDRGIIPDFHIDVDPRAHKIGLMGPPQQKTEYLIASTCHPLLFKHLDGFNVKLWHIFDTSEEGMRLLPAGEWALTGGCSVGVRTLTIARYLGFNKQHVFGMDGCFGKDGTHAADHPNSPKKFFLLEYPEGTGNFYKTTPAMLEAARNTWHELDMMKDTEVKFYGGGLVQEMAKHYVRKVPKNEVFIGMAKPELISAEYCELNRRLHLENLAYGVGGGRHAGTVKALAAQLAKNQTFVSILDYGCGKGYLAKALDFPIAEYDPAVAGKEESPRPADLVCCFDVLEHIEPDRLDYVLDDLARVTKKVGYFIIHTGPSTKCLADGRNSHLIQKGPVWWGDKLKVFFKLESNSLNFKNPPLLHAIVGPRKKKKHENHHLSRLGPQGNGSIRSSPGVNPQTDQPGPVRSDPAETGGSDAVHPSDREAGQPAMVPN